MAIIKCKMCGGDLILTEGQTVAECEYCGSRQTVPTADSEKKLVQFERAERLRKNCEFDKAAGIYESIVSEFRTESEAYWGLFLCKYGIEYVDDPATGKKVPTCHRSGFDSVMEDSDLEQALENADAIARKVYREEAKQIEEIRKGIIEVSGKEEPYDIFICYKETDENGERTIDSVIAQDVYDALASKGYRVFFSRITLEDKLGQEYEPYIFAALNSAKIMLAFGTDYEYYNAVWVKNEWSRYLKLMASDKSKHLIPCYKGIDAYDMPKEFAKLQAQDMGKVGAMQDLLRGIEKILPKAAPVTVVQERVVVGGSGDNRIASLLDRGNMALEDGDWAKADSFFEDVLNNDSKNAQAYIGKTLALERCRTIDALIRKRKDVSQNVKGQTLQLQPDQAHINAAVQKYSLPGYVQPEEVRKLFSFDLSYHSNVTERKQQYQSEESWWNNHKQLSRAEKFATGAVAENLTREKKALFAALSGRVKQAEAAEAAAKKNVQERYEAWLAQADEKAEKIYQDGLARREKYYQELLKIAKTSSDVTELVDTAKKFDQLGDYQDSKNLAEHCRKRAVEEQAKLDLQAEAKQIADKKAAAAKRKKAVITGIAAATAVIVIIVTAMVVTSMQKRNAYDVAMELFESGDYDAAVMAFQELGDYENSEAMIFEVRFAAAMEQFELGNYEAAEQMFQTLGDFAQSETMIGQIADKKAEIQKETEYLAACTLLAERRFAEAEESFFALGEYSDSDIMVKEARYQKLLALWELHTRFELHEVYLNVHNENGKIIFGMPEEFYNQIAGEFEDAYDVSIADPYEIGLYAVEHNEYTDVVVYDEENDMTNGFIAVVIEDGLKELGDYKDAAELAEKVLAHRYAYAVSMKESGNYDIAGTLFTALGEYGDSTVQSELCNILPYAEAQVGDVLTFGMYNGTALTWRVLAREGNSVLLITERCVDERHFQSNQNDPKYYVDSPIRKFLNQTFYKEAFTEEQKGLIQEKRLATTGGDVTDKLFLLSDQEANKYFTSDADRVSKEGKAWYLRTVNSVLLDVLNYREPIAMMVTSGGQVYQNDWTVDYKRGIRPAMWIDVSNYVAQVDQ